LHKLVDKDRKRLMQENARLEDNPSNNVGSKLVAIPGILGESEALRAVVEKIRIVAKAKSTVLLRGETGTGRKCSRRRFTNYRARQ